VALARQINADYPDDIDRRAFAQLDLLQALDPRDSQLEPLISAVAEGLDSMARVDVPGDLADMPVAYTAVVARLWAEHGVVYGRGAEAWEPQPRVHLVADPLPDHPRQSTAPEIKAMGKGLTDGATGMGGWSWGPDGSLVHQRREDAADQRGDGMQLRLLYNAVLAWLHVERGDLWAELERSGQPAFLLLQVLLYSVFEGRPEQRQGPFVTHRLDDLVASIGLDVRSAANRVAARHRVWRWIGLLTSIEAFGVRHGRYRDRDGAVMDLDIRGPVLVFGERGDPPDEPYDPGAPPLVVTLGPSPWLARVKGQRQVMPDFGSVPALTRITDGRPSGRWARAIGLALHQLWRERAHDAELVPVGEGERRQYIARFAPFTRVELLTLFPPDPTLWRVLQSEHPRRAVDYWKSAIVELKRHGVIATGYRELTSRQGPRYEWWREWISQPLEIRPGPTLQTDAVTIAKRAQTVGRGRRRRRKLAGPHSG
jgi:hypothetical protein